jgi:hypothetical protein
VGGKIGIRAMMIKNSKAIADFGHETGSSEMGMFVLVSKDGGVWAGHTRTRPAQLKYYQRRGNVCEGDKALGVALTALPPRTPLARHSRR